MLSDSTKPKTTNRDSGGFFVNQVSFTRFCARSHKRRCLMVHLTEKTDQSCVADFSKEEQDAIMESY